MRTHVLVAARTTGLTVIVLSLTVSSLKSWQSPPPVQKLSSVHTSPALSPLSQVLGSSKVNSGPALMMVTGLLVDSVPLP